MLARKPFVLLSLILLAVAGAAGGLYAQMESGDRGIMPLDSSGTLEVGGIHVDVGGKDAASARYAGWRIAQREGFRRLWAKATGRSLAEAPTLPDSTLDQLVSSIIIEREQIGPTRYIADLGLLFDRARAGELIGIGGEVRRSAPMLIIPVLVTSGTATSLELRNPWQRAWAQFRTSESPVDYIRLSGLGVDPLLVNAAQTRRPGRGWWRNIIDLYGAADILIAETQLHRSYPGGPASARFIARHGPDGEILGGFTLSVRDGDAVPAMMAEGVRRIDRIFTNALALGMLERDPSLITQLPPPPEELQEEEEQAERPLRPFVIQLFTPDPGTLGDSMRTIRGISGIERLSEMSTAIGGWSALGVQYRGDILQLRDQLVARGWSVELIGSALRLRRGPPPAPPAASSPASEEASEP